LKTLDGHTNDDSRVASRQHSRAQSRVQNCIDVADDVASPTSYNTCAFGSHPDVSHRSSEVLFKDCDNELRRSGLLQGGMDNERATAFERTAFNSSLQPRQGERDITDRRSPERGTLVDQEHCDHATWNQHEAQKGASKAKGVSYATSMEVVDMPDSTAPSQPNVQAYLRHALTSLSTLSVTSIVLFSHGIRGNLPYIRRNWAWK
jgi:hypothetical protein